MNARDRDRKREWKSQEQMLAQAGFPVSDSLLESLFAAVETQVEDVGCDHTLRFTSKWIAEHQQSSQTILEWLGEHGGHCDCEVVANAADHWAQNR